MIRKKYQENIKLIEVKYKLLERINELYLLSFLMFLSTLLLIPILSLINIYLSIIIVLVMYYPFFLFLKEIIKLKKAAKETIGKIEDLDF